MTNAERIRQMTDEELASFLYSYVEPCFLCDKTKCGEYKDCEDARLQWLKKEADLN